jgi:hypothetical protein
MLVNRDVDRPHRIRVTFEDAKSKRTSSFAGRVAFATFGSEQYQWINDGPNSHADPDGPIRGTTIEADSATTYILPKASITVLRGKLPGRPQ